MGALGGASSRLAMDNLFVTCSTISGIPDNLERSIFSWRKVRPVVSIARLVSSSSSLAMASRALGQCWRSMLTRLVLSLSRFALISS